MVGICGFFSCVVGKKKEHLLKISILFQCIKMPVLTLIFFFPIRYSLAATRRRKEWEKESNSYFIFHNQDKNKKMETLKAEDWRWVKHMRDELWRRWSGQEYKQSIVAQPQKYIHIYITKQVNYIIESVMPVGQYLVKQIMWNMWI